MNLSQFTSNNRYLMLALDHRGSFLKMMRADPTKTVTDDDAIKLKSKIISSLSDQMTGILIDPKYGLPAYKQKTKPFLLPVEKTGYTDQEGDRVTELEYPVTELKDLGASGVKLLLYFNPNAQSAKVQLETARKVLTESHDNNLPLFLEIVVYDKQSPKSDQIVETIKLFCNEGIVPDVFKLQFPSDAAHCIRITELLKNTPWILLTEGENFDQFKQDLTIGMQNGAAGFLAGRALWQEAGTLDPAKQDEFFTITLPSRFKELAGIVLQ